MYQEADVKDGVNVGDEIRLSESAARKRRNEKMVLRHGDEVLFKVVDKPGGVLKVASPTGLHYKILPTDIGTIVRRQQVPALL